MLASCMLVRYMDVINMCASQVRAAAHVAADIEDSANRSLCAPGVSTGPRGRRGCSPAAAAENGGLLYGPLTK